MHPKSKPKQKGREKKRAVSQRCGRTYTCVTTAAGTTARTMKVVKGLSELFLLSFTLSTTTTTTTEAANPFSSNVVALTAENWKDEVLESPHAVFVNICRVG